MDPLSRRIQFANWLASSLRTQAVLHDDCFAFLTRNAVPTQVGQLTESRIDAVLAEIPEELSADDVTLYKAQRFEMPVRSRNPSIAFSRHGQFAVRDEMQGVRYSVQRVSEAFAAYVVCVAGTHGLSSRLFFPSSRNDRAPTLDALETAASELRSPSLVIESDSKLSKSEFVRLADAFIFEATYNLDIPIVPLRHIEDVCRSVGGRRFRRSNTTEFEAPRRQYIPDLVYHYQMGAGADDPALSYLGFYHVAEHYFEAVFRTRQTTLSA